MLTPVDIQQKRFKTGIGFEKKDVQQFFDEVSKSYGELYKSNAELKERVITLTDTVQHYKTTEEDLQKTLMIAEKNSEEARSNAEKKAKNIEMEAQSRANEIVREAHMELDLLNEQITELQSRYAEYKHVFASVIKRQFDLLVELDFDPDAFIDPRYISYVSTGSTAEVHAKEKSSSYSFSAPSDPGASRDDKRSSAEKVYGDTLGGEGINPFESGGNESSSGHSMSLKSSNSSGSKISIKRTEAEKAKVEDDDFKFL